jgi:monoterpene epsilon-lactone hydrolase
VASSAAEAVKAAMRARQGVLTGSSSLEEWRAAGDAGANANPEIPGVTYEEVDCGGVRALWVRPEGAATDRVIQYLHGGGYMIGSAYGHRKFTAHLAKVTGCISLSVDYRLCPEFPCPAQLEDSVHAYRWLLDTGLAPEHVAVAGDSAGGALTLSTLLKLRDDGLPLPAGGVSFSAAADMDRGSPSFVRNADIDPAGTDLSVFERFKEAFLQGRDATDPYASPVYADFTGLSPLYLQAGGDEVRVDDSTRIAERATAAGVQVEIDVFPEMWHVFQLNVGTVPEADEAVALVASWLQTRLGLQKVSSIALRKAQAERT